MLSYKSLIAIGRGISIELNVMVGGSLTRFNAHPICTHNTQYIMLFFSIPSTSLYKSSAFMECNVIKCSGKN